MIIARILAPKVQSMPQLDPSLLAPLLSRNTLSQICFPPYSTS